MHAMHHNASSTLVLALLAYSVYEHGYEGGTATRIQLQLTPRGCVLEDDGRGIGLHREGYVVGLVEQLGARRDKVAIHGLGLALVAMSSPKLVIESRRDGRRRVQHFAWGAAQGGVQGEPWQGASGTRIELELAEDAPDITLADVLPQVELWRAGHPGLRIDVTWTA